MDKLDLPIDVPVHVIEHLRRYVRNIGSVCCMNLHESQLMMDYTQDDAHLFHSPLEDRWMVEYISGISTFCWRPCKTISIPQSLTEKENIANLKTSSSVYNARGKRSAAANVGVVAFAEKLYNTEMGRRQCPQL